jgi:hypothetical protein
MRIQISCVAFVLSSTAAAAGSVWVVAPSAGPGIDFTSVQAAVDAASDGDLVLIRGGAYPPAVVALGGKSVQLVGDVSLGQIDAHFALAADASGADRDWLLRNLVLHAPGDGQPALALSNSAGSAWIEGCTLVAEPGSAGNGGLRASALGGLLVSRGDVRPSNGAAIDASAAPAALWNTSAYGGAGALGGAGQVAPGPGVASDAFVMGSGCVIEGGQGAPPGPGCVPPTGNGAVALSLSGAATATLTGTALFGGAAGDGSGCGSGLPGAASDAPGSISTNPFGFLRALEAPSPLRESERFLLSFHGLPNEKAFCMWSLEPGFAALPALSTVLALGNAVTIFPVGVVQGGGAVPLSLVATELGAGVEFATIYAQPIFYAPFLPPGAAWSLGAPSAIVVLDRSF